MVVGYQHFRKPPYVSFFVGLLRKGSCSVHKPLYKAIAISWGFFRGIGGVGLLDSHDCRKWMVNFQPFQMSHKEKPLLLSIVLVV